MTAAGVVLDPSGFVVSNAPGYQWEPRVGFGGGYYLAAWRDDPTGSSGDLYGARVSTAGVVQDPGGIPIAVGPQHVESQSYGIAYGYPTFVVSYAEGGVLKRARIAAATGVVLDTLALTPFALIARSVIAYDSSTFVIVYEFPGPPGPYAGFGVPLQGTRLDASGADLDPVDWNVALDPGLDRNSLALASQPGVPGRTLFAYSRYDSTPGVTSDRARARLVSQAVATDLTATKTDGQATAVPGEPIAYTITVANAGPAGSTPAVVADAFPASLMGATWTCSASPGSTCTASGTGALNDSVALVLGGTATYTVRGTVDPAVTGTISNTVTVTPSGGVADPDPANNTATDVDTLTPETDLSITKTDSADPVNPGDPLTYTLAFTNHGPSDVTGVTVVDTLPAGVTFVSSVPGAPACTLAGWT